MPAVKVIVVFAAVALGALLATGCALAVLFELQGFGTPRDSDPRPLYIAEWSRCPSWCWPTRGRRGGLRLALSASPRQTAYRSQDPSSGDALRPTNAQKTVAP